MDARTNSQKYGLSLHLLHVSDTGDPVKKDAKKIERENKIKEVCLTCKNKKCSGSRKCFERARKANVDKASQK